MAMTNAGRASAIYNAIASNSTNFSQYSPAEKTNLQNQILAIWGAGDLAYIQANAQVNPNTLNNPVGQSIAVTSGPGAGSAGATDAPQVIAGLGTVS
jgi:hypothetical protein